MIFAQFLTPLAFILSPNKEKKIPILAKVKRYNRNYKQPIYLEKENLLWQRIKPLM